MYLIEDTIYNTQYSQIFLEFNMLIRNSFAKGTVSLVAVFLFAVIGAYSQWTKVNAPTPIVTYNALATQVYLDGTLYMFGGAPGLSQATAGAWSFDTKTPDAQWKTLASLPIPRVSSYAAAVNGKIYIIGGFYIANNTRVTTPEVLEYDPATNKYTTKKTMPTATYGMAGAVIGSKIYVMSGIAGGAYSNSTQVYDVETDTWASQNNTLYSAIYPTASVIGNDIYMLGGQTTGLFATVLKGTVSAGNISWKKIGDFPKAITAMASGVLGGNLFVAGGSDADGASGTTYKYDASKDKWSVSFTMPVATYYVGNMVGDGTSLYFINGADNPETYKFVDGAPKPILSFAPNSIEYKLKSGNKGQKTLNIRNLGVTELNVTIAVPKTDKWLTSESGEIIVDPGATFPVNMNVNSTGMAEGVYTSVITLTSDDATNASAVIPVKMTLVDVVAKRLPLLEVFTSSTCGPCKPGNEQLKKVIDPIDRSNYTVLKFQQDFPGTGDPYATNETLNRRYFYGINSIPRMEVDGGWDQNAQSFSTQVLNDATSQICLLNMKSNYVWDGNKITVTVSLDPLADYNESNMKLYVALMEKTTKKNVKSNGETMFEDVVKKMLPDDKGTDITAMTKGKKVTKTLEFTVPGNYRLAKDGQPANRINLATENSIEDMENLEVVVWAQNTTTREVYNSSWATEGPAGVTEDLESSTELTIGQNYPNPASGTTTISYAAPKSGHIVMDLYNLVGTKVASIVNGNYTEGVHSVSFDIQTLPSGVYTIVLKLNGQSVSKPMTVVRFQ